MISNEKMKQINDEIDKMEKVKHTYILYISDLSLGILIPP